MKELGSVAFEIVWEQFGPEALGLNAESYRTDKNCFISNWDGTPEKM